MRHSACTSNDNARPNTFAILRMFPIVFALSRCQETITTHLQFQLLKTGVDCRILKHCMRFMATLSCL